MAASAMASSIAGLYNNERLSDITIKCGDQQWYGHKAIIYTQSETFAKACEDGLKAAQDNCVDLKDDTPDIVEAMLSFFYLDDYSVVPQKETSPCPLVFNVRVFAVAEKYAIEALMIAASGKFEIAAQNDWNTEGFTIALEEMGDRVNDFEGYLRESIKTTIMAHPVELLTPTQPWTRLLDAMESVFRLSTEVAQLFAANMAKGPNVNMYSCPRKKCDVVFFSPIRPRECLKRTCKKCAWECDMTYEHWARFQVIPIHESNELTRDPNW